MSLFGDSPKKKTSLISTDPPPTVPEDHPLVKTPATSLLTVPESPAPLPKPNFEDVNATQQYRNKLYKKYGEYVKERADLPENLDYQIQDASGTLKNVTTSAAKSTGLNPALLYSSAMEEGMRGLIPNKSNKGQTDYSGNKEYPVSGYVNFGLDRFSEMAPELVKKGYLPAGFEKNFQKSPEKNEKGESVNSANFKSVDAALQAKAAVLRNTYDHVDQMAKQMNLPLSPKARDFFSLVAYNAGETNAQKMLKEYAAAGYLKDDKFLKSRPSKGWSVPYNNAMKRIRGAELLKGEGYF